MYITDERKRGNYMLNSETINRLIQIYSDDSMIMDTIKNTIMEFEEYHYAIYKMEHFMKFRDKDMEPSEYRDKVTELDNNRTRKHNSILTGMKIINRLAEQNDLAPVYEGVVSEERPYRREVANSVLDYVEDVIKNRR